MFIKLSHHDTRCLINLIEEIPVSEREEQENRTLLKLKLILEAQKLSRTTNHETENGDKHN